MRTLACATKEGNGQTHSNRKRKYHRDLLRHHLCNISYSSTNVKAYRRPHTSPRTRSIRIQEVMYNLSGSMVSPFGYPLWPFLEVLYSIQGLKNTLKTFRPVPDDALIFEFCRQGNASAVMSLLSGGHASIRDTDSHGFTPLHVSGIPSVLDTLNLLTTVPSLLHRTFIQSFGKFSRALEQTRPYSHTRHCILDQ